MSGNAAALNIEGFMYVFLNAFHQTALNFTGQNVGANNYKRAKKVFLLSLGSVFVIGVAVSVSFYLAGPYLLKIYLPDSTDAVWFGLLRLKYLCLAYFLLGMMDVSGGALRGMGVSVAPMVISVLGICGLRIGWIYTIFQIPEFHTPECLYLSYAISWAITFTAQTVAYFITYNKKKKTISK